MTGALTNTKKLTLKKDLNCLIDCVKVQPHILFLIWPQLGPFFTFWSLPSNFFGWGQVQKPFWDLPM